MYTTVIEIKKAKYDNKTRTIKLPKNIDLCDFTNSPIRVIVFGNKKDKYINSEEYKNWQRDFFESGEEYLKYLSEISK